MESYIHLNESIYAKFNSRIEDTLTTITNRYIGSNPPHPMVYRAFSKDSLTRLKDYRYDFHFADRFPHCENGQYIYAWGKLWQEEETELMFAINCYGPVQLYLNGELVYRSSIVEELDPKLRRGFRFTLQKGWNHFVLRFEKTTSGIGGIFGTGSFKRHPMHFLSPTKEREGQEGWIFTEPLDQPLQSLPEEGKESELDVTWLPLVEWKDEDRLQMARLFGEGLEQSAYAWTTLTVPHTSEQDIRIKGYSRGSIDISVNNQVVFCANDSTEIDLSLRLPYGEHELIVKSTSTCENWGFELEPIQEHIEFKLPYPVKGASGRWLYIGIFDDNEQIDLTAAKRMDTLIESKNGPTFWRLDQPNMWVRPT
ncbi:hypothetical protein [Bacillus sp. JCM 19034]|uniref:hypothetical protein n=1 Tax=Bacillus sp. JCM 19034 TaxID=1481928 RepID=UPI0007821B4C|nr:hypothetical protein [Bacillus sp. JCM 19034]